MSSTITLTGDWLSTAGNRRMTTGTGNLGTYATNGIAVSAAQVGLGTIDSLVIDPAGGYVFEYVASTGKVKAYAASGTVTGGTIGNHTHDLLVLGGAAFDSTAGIGTIASGGPKLSKTEAGNKTVVGADSATKGGVVAAALTIADMAATISAAEVGAGTNLASVTFNFRAYGR